MEKQLNRTPNRQRKYIIIMLRTLISLAVPILLVIFSVRLIMTPQFVSFEYNRPDFPDDSYGFTVDDRLRYAPIALEYLLNGEDVEFLANQRMPGEDCWPVRDSGEDCQMYNVSELRHMEDVKAVTVAAYVVGLVVILLTAFCGWLTLRLGNKGAVLTGLTQGAVLTLSIIATVVVVAVGAWERFFDLFHEMFFEAGTWRFLYSDTLIRLFPEKFWFDAAIGIGVLTVIGAVVIIGVVRQISVRN